MGPRQYWALVLAGLAVIPGQAEPLAEPPPVSGLVESARVRMILVDARVVDRDGMTVPDLTAADFEVFLRGKPVAIDTLDVSCGTGAAEDARAVRDEREREGAVADAARRLVLVLDYQHVGPMRRAEVLEHARRMVEHGGTPSEEIMVAALNGGLRVEQTFTTDHEQVLRSLKRMEYDISLWQPSFAHLNESGFTDGLGMLFDVLATVPGPKALVLFSEMLAVPLEGQFRQLAAQASAARCAIYPVDAAGLRPPLVGMPDPPSG